MEKRAVQGAAAVRSLVSCVAVIVLLFMAIVSCTEESSSKDPSTAVQKSPLRGEPKRADKQTTEPTSSETPSPVSHVRKEIPKSVRDRVKMGILLDRNGGENISTALSDPQLLVYAIAFFNDPEDDPPTPEADDFFVVVGLERALEELAEAVLGDPEVLGDLESEQKLALRFSTTLFTILKSFIDVVPQPDVLDRIDVGHWQNLEDCFDSMWRTLENDPEIQEALQILPVEALLEKRLETARLPSDREYVDFYRSFLVSALRNDGWMKEADRVYGAFTKDPGHREATRAFVTQFFESEKTATLVQKILKSGLQGKEREASRLCDRLFATQFFKDAVVGASNRISRDRNVQSLAIHAVKTILGGEEVSRAVRSHVLAVLRHASAFRRPEPAS